MKIGYLNLGITNSCNYQCIMCSHHDHIHTFGNPNKKCLEFHKRKKGFIDFKIVKKLFEEFVEDKDEGKNIVLQWIGEALMHPQFDEILEYVCKINYEYKIFDNLTINTNGYYFDKKTCDLFINLIDKYKQRITITFSMEGIKPETYKKIKQTDREINEINDNIKYLIRESKKVKNKCNVLIQCLVMLENCDELKEFKEYWVEFFEKEKLKFKTVFDYYHSSPDINYYIAFRKTDGPPIQKQLDYEYSKAKVILK